MNWNIALTLAFATTAAVAATSVRASEYTEVPPFVGTLSRAEVRAELDQARAAGNNPWADNHDPLATFQSQRTRDEVTSEYLAGRATVAAMSGEDSGSIHMSRLPAMEESSRHARLQD